VKDPYIKTQKVRNLWSTGVECVQVRN
jgi:hypothetical protein